MSHNVAESSENQQPDKDADTHQYKTPHSHNEEEHHDIEVQYQFLCEAQVSGIEILLFEAMPSVSTIQAQWMIKQGQGASEVPSAQPMLGGSKMKNDAKQQRWKSVNFTGAEKCKRLTEKRQRIFELLRNEECPLSAYELTDAYNAHYEPPIKAMSVYRILDYLTSIHLVHRLNSANKFMVCSNQYGCEGHELSLFLICSVCHKVEESVIAGKLDTLLSNSCKKTDFQIHGSQLEINGVCGQCQNR